MTDLDKPGALKLLAKSILNDIDNAAVSMYDEGPRTHLGASVIGHQCYRHLWFGFRWTLRERHDGRQLRLFNRGHREEARFNEWLNHAGYRVQSNDPATGAQWRVSGVNEHFGGSTDGICYLPARYEIDIRFLLEFKTNGTGAGFTKLIDAGCGIAKPQHYDQQSVYGYKLGITHSIYLNVNKNDDSIFAEVIKLDWKRGEDLEKKATIVIQSQTAPPRISESKTHLVCKWCHYKDQCFDGMPLERNCRSCKNAVAIENKQWGCTFYNNIIPPDFIPKGCDKWTPIYEI